MGNRLDGLDSLKGFLVVLVITGHVITGSVSENLLKEIIYFFHMPLFLAVSGYFLKRKTLSLPALEIVKKYNRILTPFLVAFVFYTALWLVFKVGFSVESILYSFLYPYYHLWYIPAVILFVFYTRVLEESSGLVYVLLCLIFVGLTILFSGYSSDISDVEELKFLGDKRFYYFFTYFYMGYLISIGKININTYILSFFFVVGILIYSLSGSKFDVGLGEFIANSSLILIAIPVMSRVGGIGFLSKIGKNSLPIYLWHVLPFLALKHIGMELSHYYIVSFVFFSVFIYLTIRLNGKNKWLNRYFYGG